MIKRKYDGLEECEMSDTVWAQIFQNWIYKCNKRHLESDLLVLLLRITVQLRNRGTMQNIKILELSII